MEPGTVSKSGTRCGNEAQSGPAWLPVRYLGQSVMHSLTATPYTLTAAGR
jgi:hypothetical protein